MKRVILLASLVMSASVFASTNTVSSHTTMSTDAYSSKQQAYDAAFDLMDEMKAMDSAELKTKLPISQNNIVYPSLQVKDVSVEVKELAKGRGDIEYKAVLDVNYQYQYRESGNS